MIQIRQAMETPDHNRPTDWTAIWADFAWDKMGETEDAVQRRLQQRARQYAAAIQRVELAPEEVRTVLTFELGSEHYGVDVMAVRGVRTIGRITRVPAIPQFYRGVVNVRGQVITVMDLRLFFGVPITEETRPPDELVVVKGQTFEMGLLAHNVEGVMTLPMESFEPVDNMRYAVGVTRERLVLLDIQRLLEDDQLVVGGQDEK